MKIKKSQLRQMIRESVKRESVSLACEQKQVAHYAQVCLHNTPFLKEYKNVKTKGQLKEFFGPFKKLGVQDLEKMGQGKAEKKKAADKSKMVKSLMGQVKAVEKARKNVAGAKLSDVGSVSAALDAYVNELVDLFAAQQGLDLEAAEKAAVSKPFVAAAYTLQNLSRALNDAAENLFSSVPKSSGVYSAGREAADIEKAQKKFMRGPAQQMAAMAKDVWDSSGRGMGIGRGRPR